MKPLLARVLSHYLDRDEYDVVIIRSTEAAHALSQLRPDLGSRLCVYVTGVVADDADVDPGVLHRLQSLVDGGATLLCQTPEMQEHVIGLLRTSGPGDSIAVLSPAVPSATDVAPPVGKGPLVLAYTGKFAPAWHTVEMLAGFKEASVHRRRPAAARGGRPLQDGRRSGRRFGAEVRHLLGSHPRISWLGAVTRSDARALVAGADVGIGWRHSSLDSSLELSTKLLEHGVLGRPCIINPTPMHRRLFGSDYPLFASSMSDFVELLTRMASDRGLVRHAADIAMDVAAEYTYEKVFRSVFPTLLSASGFASRISRGSGRDVIALCSSSERLSVREGRGTAWLTDRNDAAEILRSIGPDAAVKDVERWGPFVAWTEGPEVDRGDEAVLDLVADLLVGREQVEPERGPSGEVTVAHDMDGRVRLDLRPPHLQMAAPTQSTSWLHYDRRKRRSSSSPLDWMPFRGHPWAASNGPTGVCDVAYIDEAEKGFGGGLEAEVAPSAAH